MLKILGLFFVVNLYYKIRMGLIDLVSLIYMEYGIFWIYNGVYSLMRKNNNNYYIDDFYCREKVFVF